MWAPGGWRSDMSRNGPSPSVTTGKGRLTTLAPPIIPHNIRPGTRSTSAEPIEDYRGQASQRRGTLQQPKFPPLSPEDTQISISGSSRDGRIESMATGAK